MKMAEAITGKPLVVDNGTGLSKNGYAGEDQPRSVFPTLIGYPKYQSIMSDVDHYVREYYVGEEAMNLRGVLKLILVVNSRSSALIKKANITTNVKGYDKYGRSNNG
jgi:actin-related protein